MQEIIWPVYSYKEGWGCDYEDCLLLKVEEKYARKNAVAKETFRFLYNNKMLTSSIICIWRGTFINIDPMLCSLC